jgi:hypothetical protein
MLSTWTSATAGIRRIGIVLTLTALVVLTSAGFALAQAAAPAQAAPAAQAAPPAQVRAFTGDLGIYQYVIKAERAADFEAMIAKLKAGLQKSENPVRKAQAAGWRVFKQVGTLPEGRVAYMFLIDPVAKDADYTLSAIMYEAFPDAADRTSVYETIKNGVVGSGMVNYELIMDARK